VKRLWSLVLLVPLACSGAMRAQRPPTTAEIARILGIRIWQVRKPWRLHRIWDIQMIPASSVKPQGNPGSKLTQKTYMLAFRDFDQSTGNAKVLFTLPQQAKSYSSGDFDLTGDLPADDQLNIEYFSRPRYAKDGTQCVIGQVTDAMNGQIRYIALVLASNMPQIDPVR